MTTAQAWIDARWEESFEPLRTRGFRIQKLEAKDYWALFEAKMEAEFLPEAFFDLSKLRDGGHAEAKKQWEEDFQRPNLAIFCALYQGERLAALFSGEMRDLNTWRMWNTVVHSDFRRQGIYRTIAQGWIAFSRALGFDRVVSDHAICNNPIIIAKLKLGFQIWSLEMNPGCGPTLTLIYFHHPAHRKAYEVRCSLASLEPQHLAAGNKAMTRLKEQFSQGESPSADHSLEGP